MKTKANQVILKTMKGHGIRDLVESNVYVKDDGHRYIAIPTADLGLPEEFIYLGFTKAGNPKFGQILSSDFSATRIQKRIGRFDGRSLSVMGGMFTKSIDEMVEAAYQ